MWESSGQGFTLGENMALNIQKQKARNMQKQLLKQSRDWLKRNAHLPDDEKTSVKFVVKKIRLRHVQLALWCAENRAIHLHTYNFHDIIANYEKQEGIYKVTQEAKPDQEIAIVTIIEEPPGYYKEGTIRPSDFQAYFGRGDTK